MRSVLINRLIILLAVLALIFIPIAGAQLSSISFGFPTLTQSTSNTAYNFANCSAFDLEQANFMPYGTDGMPFPTASTSSVVGQSNNAVQFSQNTVFSAYSYPEVDTGLGFSGFNTFPGFGSLL